MQEIKEPFNNLVVEVTNFPSTSQNEAMKLILKTSKDQNAPSLTVYVDIPDWEKYTRWIPFFLMHWVGFLSGELKAQMERKVKMKPMKNNTQKYTESKFASNYMYIKLKVYNTIYSFDYLYR